MWKLMTLFIATLLASPTDISEGQMPPPELAAQHCVAVAVYMEAGGESLRGQRAVAEVIWNRAKLRHKHVCEIVTQPHQFSFYHPGFSLKASKEQLTRLKKLVTMQPVLGTAVTHFHAFYVKPKWAKKLKRVAVIGAHIFYQGKRHD